MRVHLTHNKNQWDCDIKDPSFVIHPNGTTIIAYRAVCCHCYYPGTHTVDHTERVGLLHSDDWNSTPFTRTGVPLFEESEDLFMWDPCLIGCKFRDVNNGLGTHKSTS